MEDPNNGNQINGNDEDVAVINQAMVPGEEPINGGEAVAAASANLAPSDKDAAAGAADEREAKLYVDVNVANFGIKRIIVYEGDTVESLVADFVKRCPIDEFMVEKLKLLLQ